MGNALRLSWPAWARACDTTSVYLCQGKGRLQAKHVYRSRPKFCIAKARVGDYWLHHWWAEPRSRDPSAIQEREDPANWSMTNRELSFESLAQKRECSLHNRISVIPAQAHCCPGFVGVSQSAQQTAGRIGARNCVAKHDSRRPSAMPFMPSAFARLLEPLDRRVTARLVAAHGGDRGVGSGPTGGPASGI